MIAPAGTPDAVVAKLNQAANEALKTGMSLRQMIESSGGQIMGGTIPWPMANIFEAERAHGACDQERGIFRWTDSPELFLPPQGERAAAVRRPHSSKADSRARRQISIRVFLSRNLSEPQKQLKAWADARRGVIVPGAFQRHVGAADCRSGLCHLCDRCRRDQCVVSACPTRVSWSQRYR